MNADIKDRLYLASEVFLFEALELAKLRGWTDFPTWALRARIQMQCHALEHVRDVAVRLGQSPELVAQLEKAVASTREDRDAFFRQAAFGDLEAEQAEAQRQMTRFSRRLAALKDAQSVEEIENILVLDHRRMMLTGFGTWCSDAPGLDIVTGLAKYSIGAIAFSGGGIRSASFSLGVINALANQLVLSSFHYISAVSGGGYIASWLTCWAYRRKDGMEGVQRALRENKSNCEPIRWIRRYGSYLVPQPGFLATDTWTLIVSYLRNWLPILCALLMATAFVLSIPRLLLEAASLFSNQHSKPGTAATDIGAGVCLLLILGFLTLMRYLTAFKKHDDPPNFNRQIPVIVAGGALVSTVALTLFLPLLEAESQHYGSVVSSSVGVSIVRALTIPSWWIVLYLAATVLAFNLPMVRKVGARLLKTFLRMIGVFDLRHRRPRRARYERRIGIGRGLVGAVFGGAICGYALSKALPHLPLDKPEQLITIGPLIGVLTFGLAEVAVALLIEKSQSDKDRAWASRLGGWILGTSVVWALVCLLSLHGLAIREALGGKPTTAVVCVVTLAVLASIGYFAKYRWSAIVISALMSLTLLFALSVLLVEPTLNEVFGLPFEETSGPLLVALVVALVVFRIDVNRYSLHSIYREGLVRTFLGASRLSLRETDIEAPAGVRTEERAQFMRRDADPATNIDDDDDPRLEWLVPRGDRKFPLLLLNAAVNGKSALDTEGRFPRQWPFSFSSLFCGSPASGIGYAPTRYYPRGSGSDEEPSADASTSVAAGGLTLGTAAAVSGAAVSPASGRITHPIKAFLMSLLNARLGLWIRNPSDRTMEASDSRLAVIPFMRELLGLRANIHRRIHLSDGGHFENLGLYELLRRGCSVIVVVDASCDPKGSDDDFGNAIRRARIDLGIEIQPPERPQPPNELPGVEAPADAAEPSGSTTTDEERAMVSALAKSADKQQPSSDGSRGPLEAAVPEGDGSWALYEIKYGVDLPRGRLLYLKPKASDVGVAMPSDVKNYRSFSSKFPHETTADQFFTEAQMEAYRVLGEMCAFGAYVGAVRSDAAVREFFLSAIRPSGNDLAGETAAVSAGAGEKSDTNRPPNGTAPA